MMSDNYKNNEMDEHFPDREKLIFQAKEVVALEAGALQQLEKIIDLSFVRALRLIEETSGHLIFCGIGKAGLIAQKIASTFSSLGKPSFFLHPAEAIHGDLGAVGRHDLVILWSKSGYSHEVVSLLPILKNMGVKIISITANEFSEMAVDSDVFLPLAKVKEACSLGLAPTTSTTQMLALGDALAVVYLTRQKDFSEQSFAQLHPGGSLGKKLKKVESLMKKNEEIVLVSPEESLKNTLILMTKKRVGCALVVDSQNTLQGFFSDGDLRRYFATNATNFDLSIKNLIQKKPIVARVGELVEKARDKMIELKIGDIPIVDEKNIVLGLLSLKDIDW